MNNVLEKTCQFTVESVFLLPGFKGNKFKKTSYRVRYRGKLLNYKIFFGFVRVRIRRILNNFGLNIT